MLAIQVARGDAQVDPHATESTCSWATLSTCDFCPWPTMSNQQVYPASALPYVLTPLAVCRPAALGSELGRGVFGPVGLCQKQ